MLVIGKSEKSAFKLLSDLQAELQYNHRYIKDFGKQYNAGSWEEGKFVTRSGKAFIALGRGQSPRGLRHKQSRPDYIVFDDIDDDQMVKKEARVNKIYDWLMEAVRGSMDMGRGRFIGVGNRIHKKSIIARYSQEKGVYHTVVNALDKQGQPIWSEKYTLAEIEDEIAFMGYRRSQKEYFNNPVEEGTIFKEQWINWGKVPKLEEMELVLYGDPSFKDGTKNDYKAVRLWGIKNGKLYLLRSFVRQSTVTNMVNFYYNVHESLPEGASCQYWMEANFLQDTLLDQFKVEGEVRGYQLPIRGDKRKKPNKFLRIENTSPYYERGVITYDEKLKEDKDTKTGTEQLLAFEKGSRVHDDAPDADEGAIYMLQKNTKTSNFVPLFGERTHSRSW
jgi:predicted phage terminase large subunit-like protein